MPTHPATAATAKTRPIQRFAAAAAQCSAEGAAYGRCITADFNDVHKDKCAREFAALRECFVRASKKRA